MARIEWDDYVRAVQEYPFPEARPHEPSVRIDDGWAMMPAEQWVDYARLSASFFRALREIIERPDLAIEIAEGALGVERDPE